LSQKGAKALAQSCGIDWHGVDIWYYTGHFVKAGAPPPPDTTFSRPVGTVKLNFPARVEDSGTDVVSKVGWHYTVDAYIYHTGTGYSWTTIYDAGWKWGSRNVPTSYTYSASGCWKYRANASNPVGTSAYATFNGGSAICTG
jgi:hypothetical protein